MDEKLESLLGKSSLLSIDETLRMLVLIRERCTDLGLNSIPTENVRWPTLLAGLKELRKFTGTLEARLVTKQTLIQRRKLASLVADIILGGIWYVYQAAVGDGEVNTSWLFTKKEIFEGLQDPEKEDILAHYTGESSRQVFDSLHEAALKSCEAGVYPGGLLEERFGNWALLTPMVYSLLNLINDGCAPAEIRRLILYEKHWFVNTLMVKEQMVRVAVQLIMRGESRETLLALLMPFLREHRYRFK